MAYIEKYVTEICDLGRSVATAWRLHGNKLL
jgi:hypothetical protein